MIPIPRSVYIALAIALALFGLYRYGFHNGWAERDAEMQQAIAAANEKSRETEQRLNAEINDVNNTLSKANEALEKESSALDRAIRAGRVRLPTSSCVSTGSGSTTPSGAGNETTSESDRETLQLIAQIAADGDRAINQLNACIDAYNQVRERINGQR
jgi:uncharacterized phage infection (PIP) family protein YhgE